MNVPSAKSALSPLPLMAPLILKNHSLSALLATKKWGHYGKLKLIILSRQPCKNYFDILDIKYLSMPIMI